MSVWAELKKRLHEQFPSISFTTGGPKKVKERLVKVLPLVWDTIEQEFFAINASTGGRDTGGQGMAYQILELSLVLLFSSLTLYLFWLTLTISL